MANRIGVADGTTTRVRRSVHLRLDDQWRRAVDANARLTFVHSEHDGLP